MQGFSQTAQLTGTPVASTQVTLGSAVAVGDVLCIFTTSGNDATVFKSSVTDSLGNRYTRLKSSYRSVDDQSGDVWFSIVSVAGTPTITYTPDLASHPWLGIWGDHFTGAEVLGTFRSIALNLQLAPGTGTDALTSTAVTTVKGDLMWGANMDISLATAVAIGTGFTVGVDNNDGVVTEYRTDPVTSQAATFTDATNGATHNYFTATIVVIPATPRLQAPFAPQILDGWGE